MHRSWSGGPFPVDTAPGTRTLMLLAGTQGSMWAVLAPLP